MGLNFNEIMPYYLVSCSETDISGRITFITSDFSKLSGYSREELVGSRHNLVRHPDMPKQVFHNLWKTITSGKEWFGIVKNRNKKGEGYWVYSFIFPVLSGGKIIGYRSVRTPIHNQDLIAKIERYYQQLMAGDEALELVRGKIYNENDRIDNFSLEGRVNALHSYLKCSCFLDMEVLFGLLHNDAFDDLVMTLAKNISYLVFDLAISVDNLNNLLLNNTIYETGRDNNIITRLEKEFVLAAKRLINLKEETKQHQSQLLSQSRHALMGEMIAMISHQWRQPLTVLRLNSDIIFAKINTMDISAEDKRFLNARNSVIKNMLTEQAQLVDDFSDFFKPDKEKYHFPALSSVDSALLMFESSFSSYGIELRQDIDDAITIYGIEREFRQVVVNIVKNAIDQLIKKDIRLPYIGISVQRVDNTIEIAIKDNAGGIPDHILPRIFEAYVSSKSLNGTGLGLYMVKMIVADHFEGKVMAENDEYGAVFKIVVPDVMWIT